MDVHYLISLLTRAKLSIPFTCTSIRDEIQNNINQLNQQTKPPKNWVEVVPMEDIETEESSIQESESDHE